MTYSPFVAAVLDGSAVKKCTHRHVHLVGGRRTALAAVYPPRLVVAALKALRAQMVEDGATTAEEMANGGSVPDEGDVHEQLQGTYALDGQWIEPALLAAGRREEMEYMAKHGVYEVVDAEECTRHQGRP